ncbi:MAG: OmpA family protein, partial [Gammaproteobacteria bacterium]
AVAGAVIGGLLGHGYHATEQVADLRSDLYSSQLELARLQEEAGKLRQEAQLASAELDRVRNQARVIPATLQQSVSPCCDNTVLSLHFRTGSSSIETVYEEQLTSMVKLARAMPTAAFEITGYADRNGDADANLDLSRKRSEAVRSFLNDNGIERASITTVGYGETRPYSPNQSLETDFFDRRVIVRLKDSSSSMLAENPGTN